MLILIFNWENLGTVPSHLHSWDVVQLLSPSPSPQTTLWNLYHWLWLKSTDFEIKFKKFGANAIPKAHPTTPHTPKLLTSAVSKIYRFQYWISQIFWGCAFKPHSGYRLQHPITDPSHPLKPRALCLWLKYRYRYSMLNCALLLFQFSIKQVRQLSGLAYIPTCRSPSPQIDYNVPDRTNDLRNMRYQRFSLFGLGANPWAKVHQKGRWPGGLLDLPSCKISSPYVNPRPRYPLPKIRRTHTHTNKQ